MAKGNHSIDKVRDTQADVQKSIETKKGELSQLEENKSKLLEAGREIQDSEMDDQAKRTVMDLINKELEANAEKGDEKSQEMTEDLQKLETSKEEVETMKEGSAAERQKLENKKGLLERFGLGGQLDSAISNMENQETELDNLHQSLIDDESELNRISQKLAGL